MYDVVVIGANLSGATAALEAARYGASVAVIEKNAAPLFPPRCGEAISCRALEEFNLKKYVKHTVTAVRNVTGAGSAKTHVIRMKYTTGAVIDRFALEKDLREDVKKARATLVLGSRAIDFEAPNTVVLGDGRRVEGRVIIDASGISARIAGRAGMATKIQKEDVGVCAFARVSGEYEFEENAIQVNIGKPYAPSGYAWFFPIDGRTVNVGLGMQGDVARDLKKNLMAYIDAMFKSRKEVELFTSCVPLSAPMERVVKDNVMAVGDAARFVSPITGAGIGNALASGRAAGITAAKYIAGECQSLEPYQQKMAGLIKELKRQYALKKFGLKSERRFESLIRCIIPCVAVLHILRPSFIERFGVRTVDTLLWLQKNKTGASE